MSHGLVTWRVMCAACGPARLGRRSQCGGWGDFAPARGTGLPVRGTRQHQHPATTNHTRLPRRSVSVHYNNYDIWIIVKLSVLPHMTFVRANWPYRKCKKPWIKDLNFTLKALNLIPHQSVHSIYPEFWSNSKPLNFFILPCSIWIQIFWDIQYLIQIKFHIHATFQRRSIRMVFHICPNLKDL